MSASWLMIAKTIGFVVATAMPLVLARRLSLNEFGNYKQLFLLLTSAANLLPLGMNMSTFYFLPRAKDTDEKGRVVFGILLYYAVITGIAGACFVISPSLVTSLFHSEALGRIGRLIGVTIIFYVTSLLFESIAVANGESQIGAAVIVGSNLLRTTVILTTAVVWGHVEAIAWGTLGFSILQSGLLVTYLESRFPGFWHSFDWHHIRDQLSYAIPLGAAGFLWSLQTDLHNYFVSHQFGPAMFAIYAQGIFQLPLIGILADSVASVLIPRVSALQKHDGRREIVDLTVKVMRSLSLAYFPIFAFLLVMAREVVIFLFTTKFLASVPIFRVNLLFLPLSVVMVDPVMRAYKEQRFWMLKVNVIVLIVLVVTLQLGISSFGLIGTISCVVGVQYLSRFALLAHVGKFLNLRWGDIHRLSDVGKTAIASLGAAGIALGIRSVTTDFKPFVSLLITGVPFVAAYIALLFVFKVPAPEELAFVRDKLLTVRALVVPTGIV
jgi:O-antigen/teichoic acid export membrane protein